MVFLQGISRLLRGDEYDQITQFSDRQHVEASLIEYRSLKLGKNQKN